MSWRRLAPQKARLAAVSALLLVLAACSNASNSTPGAPHEALPDWIVDVRPAPGAQGSALKLVEVEHAVQTGGRDVRLIVDGVDVTAASDFGSEERITGPGRIVFDPVNDPQAANTAVRLDAGEHTATLELVELEEIGEGSEVVDSFSWSFELK